MRRFLIFCKKVLTFCVKALIFCVIFFGVWRLWPSSGLTRQFKNPLPESAQLDHHYFRRAGFSDISYAFRFTFEDDTLRDQLIEDWGLEKVTAPDYYKLTSFVSLDPPSWWPKDHIQALDERYEFDDEETERYWCVWIDRKNKWLYAEHGRW